LAWNQIFAFVKPSRLPGVLPMLLMSILLTSFLTAATYSLRAPILHIDGAFQTASFLYRIYSGDIPGRDFLPYLGLGIGWFIYAPFALLGARLSDSEFIVVLLTQLSLAIGALLIADLTNDKAFPAKPLRLIIIVAFALIVSQSYLYGRFLADDAFNSFLEERILPGASLRNLRSFIVYVEVFTLYFLIPGTRNSALRLLWVALISGLASIWTLDYSLPALLTGWLFYFLYHLPSSASRIAITAPDTYNRTGTKYSSRSYLFLFLNLLSLICLSIFASFIFISIMTQGHFLEYFAYIRGVSRDQQWYFNLPVYGSEYVARMQSVWQLFGFTLSWPLILSLLILVYSLFKALFSRSISYISLFSLGAGLLASGILTSYSSATPAYYGAFVSWGCLVALGLLIDFLFRYLHVHDLVGFSGATFFLSLLLLLIPVSMALNTFFLEKKRINVEILSGKSKWLPLLNSYGPPWMLNDIENVNKIIPREATVISDYWNWLNLSLSTKNILRVDSLIHAIGSEREKSIKLIHQTPADYVFTTSLGFSKDWSRWNMSYNWWFFKDLRRDYRLFYRGTSINVWKRKINSRDNPSPLTLPVCRVKHDNNSFFVYSSRPIFLASLRFSLTQNPTDPRHFYILSDRFNDGAGAGSFDGFSALNPYSSLHERPVLVSKGKNEFRLYELDGFKRRPLVTSHIKSVTCSILDYPEISYYNGQDLPFNQAVPWNRNDLHSSSGLEYLGFGWQNPRDLGIYSGGDSSIILNLSSSYLYSLSSQSSMARLNLAYSPWFSLPASVEATARYRQRSIIVSVNGVRIGTLPADKPKLFSSFIEFPSSMLVPGLNLVHFQDLFASSPYNDFNLDSGSRSGDKRKHSFILTRLSITP
jgi:hypothetical protein